MRYHPNTGNLTALSRAITITAALFAPLMWTPAQAHEWCPPATVSCSTHVTTSTATSPYAVPLAALDGHTLATYVAGHHHRDPRLDEVR